MVASSIAARRVTGGAFDQAAVAALSARQGEPEWLATLRRTAWGQANALPFPSGFERAWKYLDPERLRVEGLTAAAGQVTVQTGTLTVTTPDEAEESARAAATVGDAAAGEGVIVTSLAAAVRTHPELVQAHLGSLVPADESVFVAWNTAFWEDGLFVYVPRDTKATLPLGSLLRLTGAGVALFPRALILVDRGGEAFVLDERAGGDGTAFASSVTEIVLADDAKLHHFVVQRWGDAVQELSFQRATLGRNAQLVTGVIGLGGAVAKGWIESAIKGTGARSEILGTAYGTGQQYFDIITLQDHIGDHTVSDLLIKSALTDASQSAYYGLTRINATARMADANQEDRNLLLSDQAKAEADPVLEILTSEVARCAHGASAGPVDQEQLFYLECRGLPRPAAEQLLVLGFLGEVLGRVTSEPVRAYLTDAVRAKLEA